MRRRTLLLAAGLFAYYLGASVRVYLRDDPEMCICRNAECRIVLVAEHPRVPLKVIEFLVAPVCS
jgi:hypothetical protein